jgi:hypothetical protein
VADHSCLGTPLVGLADALDDPARPAGHLYAGIRQHLFARPGHLGTLDEDAVGASVEDLAVAVSDALAISLSDARRRVAGACRQKGADG